jgi:hypothetical protein
MLRIGRFTTAKSRHTWWTGAFNSASAVVARLTGDLHTVRGVVRTPKPLLAGVGTRKKTVEAVVDALGLVAAARAVDRGVAAAELRGGGRRLETVVSCRTRTT